MQSLTSLHHPGGRLHFIGLPVFNYNFPFHPEAVIEKTHNHFKDGKMK